MDLFLLRHTKSSWSGPGSHDHDRTLNERGREAADLLAEHFQKTGIKPDVIFSSSAQRTVETLAPILDVLGKNENDVEYTPAIYEAPVSAYVELICEAGNATSVLVVGHNPTTEELAIDLCKDGVENLLVQIATGYPTGGLTHITFKSDNWADALSEGGKFVSFVSPKKLPI